MIIRTENVTVDNKISGIIKGTKEEVFELDFSKLTLPNVAVMSQDEAITSYGNKPVSDLMKPDVKIEWYGTYGRVTGTFLKVTDWKELPKEPHSGHYFAMVIDKKYLGKPFSHSKEGGTESTTPAATADEMFWVLNIDDKKKHTFKSGDETIAVLDFSSAVLLKR